MIKKYFCPIIIVIITSLNPYFIMSNEQIMEEQFHFAYLSGVLKEFSEEISKITEKKTNKTLYEISDDIFNRFIKEGLIDEVYLFI